MIEGSAFGSRRPKNMWIRWIRIRIRIHNTGQREGYNSLLTGHLCTSFFIFKWWFIYVEAQIDCGVYTEYSTPKLHQQVTVILKPPQSVVTYPIWHYSNTVLGKLQLYFRQGRYLGHEPMWFVSRAIVRIALAYSCLDFVTCIATGYRYLLSYIWYFVYYIGTVRVLYSDIIKN